jgi:general secretion pathway protein L
VRWIGAWPDANLLPPEDRPRRSKIGAITTGLLAALVVLIAAAILITPLWQKTRELEIVQRDLRRVRIAAEEVEQVREDLERARLGSVEVLQRKQGQPRMTDLLRELTDLLPDGTWVQTLNVNDGQADIRGESTQATALIGLLEQGPGISQVTFRSPVMQVGGTGQERFHIAFSYSRLPAP